MNFTDHIRTWKQVMLNPSAFYKRMPATGGYTDPLIFAAICVVINSLLVVFARPGIAVLMGMGTPRTGFSVISRVIILFIFGITSIFILALLFNFLYRVFGGTGDYEGTLRFVSYASAPIIFTWIPILGLIIGIYQLYLYIVGGMAVHKVSLKKSAILISVFGLIGMFFGIRAILASFAN